MADRFDVNAARQAGYSDMEIANYLRSLGRNPGEQFFYAAKGPDLRPTPARPLAGGPELDTSPEAGEALLRYGIMPAFALGTGALGGPATMTAKQMFLPAAEAFLGPFDEQDPRLTATAGIPSKEITGDPECGSLIFQPTSKTSSPKLAKAWK